MRKLRKETEKHELGDFPKDMRKYNYPGPKPPHLTSRINLYITPYMRVIIEKLVKKGKFPNISEAIRHMIIKYIDEVGLEYDR